MSKVVDIRYQNDIALGYLTARNVKPDVVNNIRGLVNSCSSEGYGFEFKFTRGTLVGKEDIFDVRNEGGKNVITVKLPLNAINARQTGLVRVFTKQLLAYNC